MALNGRLNTADLMQVDGWAFLETGTAHAWNAAAAELLAVTGIRPIISSPIGAYRTYAQQVATKAEFIAQGKGNQAAYPGMSNHGLGTAVDVNNIGHFRQSTIDTIMLRHGFTRDVTFESWHYHHVTNVPSDNTSTASSSSTKLPTIPTISEEEIMKVVQCAGRGIWLVGPNYKHNLTPEESVQVLPHYPAAVDFGTNVRAFDVYVAAHTQAQ
jgi:hypothetical protein